MAGAFDFIVEHFAFGEGSLGVATAVIDCVDFVSDAEHRNTRLSIVDSDASVYRHFGEWAYGKFAHTRPSS
jgi:hypothetical protein